MFSLFSSFIAKRKNTLFTHLLHQNHLHLELQPCFWGRQMYISFEFLQYRFTKKQVQPSVPKIIYEDKYLLAVNKPQGIVSEHELHLRFSVESMALDYCRSREKHPQKCFIGMPQRLDRPVSGVLLFAKKRSVLKMLVETFTRRELDKSYYAVVETRPEKDEAELVNWLVKDTLQRKAILHKTQVKDSVRAVLRYQFISQNNFGTLLKVKLVTGKFHQIRAQLAHIGSPIIGDDRYGSTKGYIENAVCLHARSLEIVHPVTNEPLKLIAETPEDAIWNSFAEYFQ